MRLLTYLFLALLLSSCSLFDNEDPIPGFLVFDNPAVSFSSGQGANTHKITDVWVFDGPDFLGIFPLPARVPVIIDGAEKDFTVFAGVRNNGVSSNALRYPFYEPVEFAANLTAQEEKEIPLTFSYSVNTKFDLVEDFEASHLFIEDPNEDDGPGTELILQSDVVRSGSSSGHIFFDTDTSTFERTTLFSFDRQDNSGSSTFIELDYKCEIPLLVGWITYENNFIQRDYNVLIAPSAEWNKIYIDISEFVGQIDIDRYSIAFASAISSTDAFPASIYIDNVKLLHF